MNEKQLKVIKIAAAIIGLMLIYPPYRIYGYGTNSNGIVDTGYEFIFSLPDRAVVDILTLLIQWIGVAIVAFAIIQINRNK
ncbi:MULTISPECIES: hypothetical protein [unclassified Polynucleobacter]|uniref:hypothetical protein n=1 Tax=unclassified Polynucleobacter TaxID=2640945 RepID=UPI002572804E|nr:MULTISPECIES: hypothetical protein [unclassified Polynucleobacter]BEI43328.1 hypothetical protein PHIN10_14770 [Polynucleobacter sp. HIN10]BEI45104.1 hypothetical protein PHIN11_14760 [Polynucleobacter sp. HIN11]